eukprot:gene16144-4896_t
MFTEQPGVVPVEQLKNKYSQQVDVNYKSVQDLPIWPETEEHARERVIQTVGSIARNRWNSIEESKDAKRIVLV